MRRLTCVVDNSAKRGSTFWGEHGLSLLIETDDGCVLWDTGASGTVLLHNQEQLGRRWCRPQAVVLSHAHADHTGGLRVFLEQHPQAKLYAHPDIGRPRSSVRQGRYKSIGLPMTVEELTELADVRLSAERAQVIPGLWTTGEITGRTEPEGRSAQHFVPEEGGWAPDPYRDDMSLVLETDEGLAVILGCCHAGLLNTLRQVRETFQRPISLVAGGSHLHEASPEQLREVARALVEVYDSPRLYLNHCTGERALVELATTLSDRANPFPAGTTLALD